MSIIPQKVDFFRKKKELKALFKISETSFKVTLLLRKLIQTRVCLHTLNN